MELHVVIVLTAKRHQNDELKEGKTDRKFNTRRKGGN